MKIRLCIDKTVHDNAAYYYDQAKEMREKAKGLETAIAETKKRWKRRKKRRRKKLRN